VKLKKTKKIDVRLDQALFDLVDTHAQSARLSRGQVVERALLQYLGQPVVDAPSYSGKGSAQLQQIGPVSATKKTA